MNQAVSGVSSTIVNAFSIDVEDYFHVEALAPSIPRAKWSEMEYRCEASMQRLLALMSEHGVRGTMFVLGWVAERSPHLVREIVRAGHEVACHGYSHRLVYRQEPEVFREETARAKNLLEDLTGRPVLGYRAASFSIIERSKWALDCLIDLGFTYDSSVFPVRHDRYGMPEAELAPYKITAPSGRSIVEFPMSVATLGRLRVPVSGGGYFRILPYAVTRAGLKQINQRRRQPFVFYLHPWEVDPEQPRVSASLFSTFRHYTNLSRCEGRLRRLMSDFRFATMRQVLATEGLIAPQPGPVVVPLQRPALPDARPAFEPATARTSNAVVGA
jgi:polysaccharide deacetylase family protein (PEP-CTERM system associated)